VCERERERERKRERERERERNLESEPDILGLRSSYVTLEGNKLCDLGKFLYVPGFLSSPYVFYCFAHAQRFSYRIVEHPQKVL
jgi:hypothetical protein